MVVNGSDEVSFMGKFYGIKLSRQIYERIYLCSFVFDNIRICLSILDKSGGEWLRRTVFHR